MGVAAISGFGAVNFPFRSMHSFLQPVTQKQVVDVEQRLLRTMRLIATKKRLVLNLQQGQRLVKDAPSSLGAKLLSTAWAAVGEPIASALGGGNSVALERRRLRGEIEALESFSRELFIELDELIRARLRELQARTRCGRLMNVLGWCCSAICVY